MGSVDDLEQYSRRNCLFLHIVKETKNQNIDEVTINTLSEEMARAMFGLAMVVPFSKIAVIKLVYSDHKRGFITLWRQVEFKLYLSVLVHLHIRFGKLDSVVSLLFLTWCFP